MRPFLFQASALVILLCCARTTPPTTQDVTVAVNSTCRFIEATTDDGTVKTVCATIEEIGAIVSLFVARRGDAGSPVGRCSVLPTTSFCATPAEVSEGIDVINARRAATLRDGGVR